MKERIRNWLGIDLIEKNASLDLVSIARAEAKIKSLEIDLDEYKKENQHLTMCVKGMLDHLDLEWHREEILDPRIIYQPPTIPIIKFAKRKKFPSHHPNK